MNDAHRTAVTMMLQQARAGDLDARERLFARVYDELHELAARQMRGEAGARTMQPTALVNEACMRLLDPDALAVEDRSHFFALAVTVMRRVLVDQYRRRSAQRRGGGELRVTFDEALLGAQHAADGIDVLALDAALDKLTHLDPRKGQVVAMRFYSGLSVVEVATALQVSQRTVESDWYFARAWLRAELTRGAEP